MVLVGSYLGHAFSSVVVVCVPFGDVNLDHIVYLSLLLIPQSFLFISILIAIRQKILLSFIHLYTLS